MDQHSVRRVLISDVQYAWDWMAIAKECAKQLRSLTDEEREEIDELSNRLHNLILKIEGGM